jgi:Lipoate-protein ligase A
MKLRLIDASASPGIPGALNMGIDEALLGSVSRGEAEPTLRLYTWSPPCVTVGYFQSLEAEVDLEACSRLGVDAVRRLTGGGAVFHDRELTYSIVLPLGHELAPEDILDSYKRICSGLVEGLRLVGVEAAFAPINDIVAGGKKISGNAQTRKSGCLLQHGTILLGSDPEKMFSLLKVPAEKLKGKLIEDVKARVTSLGSLLGREVPPAEAGQALVRGCGRAWGADFIPGSLSPEEAAAAQAYSAERFSASTWNAKR